MRLIATTIFIATPEPQTLAKNTVLVHLYLHVLVPDVRLYSNTDSRKLESELVRVQERLLAYVRTR
jgi:hypothetical protein